MGSEMCIRDRSYYERLRGRTRGAAGVERTDTFGEIYAYNAMSSSCRHASGVVHTFTVKFAAHLVLQQTGEVVVADV